MVYLTSRAGECLGERADVYEWGGVTALVGCELGAFHAGAKSAGCKGKNISSGELSSYLCEKHGVGIGAKLPIWFPRAGDDRVLFLGLGVTAEEADCRFDERFRRVELDYRKRYGEWVFIEDNCISFTAGVRQGLPRRLALYSDGAVLGLLGDPNGPYLLEYRGSRKEDAVYCSQLTEYCMAEFGSKERSILLHAEVLENGVCFTRNEADLPQQGRLWSPERLDLGLPRDRFVRPLQWKSFYLSAKAVDKLGNRVNVYGADGFLAFKGENTGTFVLRENKYSHLIHSAALYKLVKQCYPDIEKLYLCEHGDLLVLLPSEEARVGLPSPERFRRINMPSRIDSRQSRPARPATSNRSADAAAPH